MTLKKILLQRNLFVLRVSFVDVDGAWWLMMALVDEQNERKCECYDYVPTIF